MTPSGFSEWLEGKIALLTKEADREGPVWSPRKYDEVTREAYYESMEIFGDFDIEEPPRAGVVCCGDKIEDAQRRKALRWLHKLRDTIEAGPQADGGKDKLDIPTPLQIACR